MNFSLRILCFVLFFLATHSSWSSLPKAGFFLPDELAEITLKFRNIENLIVLPVVINDTVKVNLILDTGCRNLVLFGKRFTKLFHTEPDQKIRFSGLGNGKPINAELALGNKVSIHAVLGQEIPIVIVPSQNLFASYSNVHGIIGYDIFIKFEIELSFERQLITFRPAATADISAEYAKIPLRVEDSRPFIQSKIFLSGNNGEGCDLMLDTGSSLGLLVKTSDLKRFPQHKSNKKILGRGLNGDIYGITTTAEKLIMGNFEFNTLPVGITYSPWHNYASIGMGILKEYTIVLNYCKAYAGLKKNTISKLSL